MRRISSRRQGGSFAVLMVTIVMVATGTWARSNYKTLHRFASDKDGRYPPGVIFDKAGNLYGPTPWGGDNEFGTIFKLTPNSDGRWRKSVLYNFCSLTNCTDGANPYVSLIFDDAGNLYGTTDQGGNRGFGSVFKLEPNSDGTWSESVLYGFCSVMDCADGANPDSRLTLDQAGNLYGTTEYGGNRGFGTVFKLTPHPDGSWTESVLHRFCALPDCSDGAYPFAGLIIDGTGNLYGTTMQGGNLRCSDYGCGVVFKLTPHPDGSWTESVLYSFCGLAKCRDGASPGANLIFDRAGSIYSTTKYGGVQGVGTVFQLAPNPDGTWKERVLHSFRTSDGSNPFNNSLIFDSAGNLYGTTSNGGGKGNCFGDGGCGVVFKLTPNSNGGWSRTVLHRFVDHPGAIPVGGLIFDAAGNLYGTTNGTGFDSRGSVFEITP